MPSDHAETHGHGVTHHEDIDTDPDTAGQPDIVGKPCTVIEISSSSSIAHGPNVVDLDNGVIIIDDSDSNQSMDEPQIQDILGTIPEINTTSSTNPIPNLYQLFKEWVQHNGVILNNRYAYYIDNAKNQHEKTSRIQKREKAYLEIMKESQEAT